MYVYIENIKRQNEMKKNKKCKSIYARLHVGEGYIPTLGLLIYELMLW